MAHDREQLDRDAAKILAEREVDVYELAHLLEVKVYLARLVIRSLQSRLSDGGDTAVPVRVEHRRKYYRLETDAPAHMMTLTGIAMWEWTGHMMRTADWVRQTADEKEDPTQRARLRTIAARVDELATELRRETT